MERSESYTLHQTFSRLNRLNKKYFWHDRFDGALKSFFLIFPGPLLLIALIFFYSISFFTFLLFLVVAVVAHLIFMYLGIVSLSTFLDRRASKKLLSELFSNGDYSNSESYALYEILVSMPKYIPIVNELKGRSVLPQDLAERHDSLEAALKAHSSTASNDKPSTIDITFSVAFDKVYELRSKEVSTCSNLVFNELLRAQDVSYNLCTSEDAVKVGLMKYFAAIAEAKLGVPLRISDGCHVGIVVAASDRTYLSYLKLFAEQNSALSTVFDFYSIGIIPLGYVAHRDIPPEEFIDFTALEISRKNKKNTLFIVEQPFDRSGYSGLFNKDTERALADSCPSIGQVAFDDGKSISVVKGYYVR